MAIIVEDGTGLTDAEAYVSVADFLSYCGKKGYAAEDFDEELIEQKLRDATQYIDGKWRYKGIRLTAEQALEFPRSDLVDWSGYTVTDVPKRVREACCELTFKAASGENLQEDLDRGGMVKTETVGPISTTYMDGAPATKTFTAAANMLKPYIRDPKQILGAPQLGEQAAPQFDIGMHDNPPTSKALE